MTVFTVGSQTLYVFETHSIGHPLSSLERYLVYSTFTNVSISFTFRFFTFLTYVFKFFFERFVTSTACHLQFRSTVLAKLLQVSLLHAGTVTVAPSRLNAGRLKTRDWKTRDQNCRGRKLRKRREWPAKCYCIRCCSNKAHLTHVVDKRYRL